MGDAWNNFQLKSAPDDIQKDWDTAQHCGAVGTYLQRPLLHAVLRDHHDLKLIRMNLYNYCYKIVPSCTINNKTAQKRTQINIFCCLTSAERYAWQ